MSLCASLTLALPRRAFSETLSPSGDTHSLPKLIVGGGATSLAQEAAPVLASALARGLASPNPLTIQYEYGHDGVTAANAFDRVSTAEGGATAILTPGAALIAALAGDPRVHFDCSRWIALMLAQRHVITLAKTDLHQSLRLKLKGMIHDRPVRVAVSQLTGIEFSSVLGLSLLGLKPVPIVGYASSESALSALRSGSVDAVQLVLGENDQIVLREAMAYASPLFFSGPAPALPIPTFEQTYQTLHGTPPDSPLYRSWRAVSQAAATALILALPMLTPPVVVARWRHAASDTLLDPGFEKWAQNSNLTAVAGEASAPLLSSMTPDLAALLALRRWVSNNAPRWRLGQETSPR